MEWENGTLGVIALTATAWAVAAQEVPALPTPTELAAVQLALDRGQSLYEYDQAAWHTTDALLEDIDDPGQSGVRGWVVTPAENGWLVTFWKVDGEGYAGVYSAVWTGTQVASRKVLGRDDAQLTKEQIELIRARLAVNGDELPRCSDSPFNSVILPQGEDGTALVYLLTPRTAMSSLPLGGHYRFTVKDGQVIDKRHFSTSCIEAPVQANDEDREEKPSALMISHLLDPVPTEIHSFSVFAAGVPLYVMTTPNGRLWAMEVSGGQARARVVRQDADN